MYIIFFTPLLLYFPVLIPGVETQALVALAAALVLLFRGRSYKAFVGLFSLASILVVFVLALHVFGDASAMGGYFQLLIGPTFLMGCAAGVIAPPNRRLMAVAALYLFSLVIFEVASPSAYRSVAESLMHRVTVADGHRGVSLLTPEPTYGAITALYFVVLSHWSRQIWGSKHPWVEFLLYACLLSTMSTYLAIFAMVLLLVRWPYISVALCFGMLLGLIGLDSVALNNDDSIRIVVALSRLLSIDIGDFLASISILDSSLGSRVLTNAAGFFTPFVAPLGFGVGCEALPDAFRAAGMWYAFENPVLVQVMDIGCLKAQAYIPTVFLALGGFGLIFLIVLCVVFFHTIKLYRRKKVWSEVLALSLVLLVVQAQLTNPIPWLLLYIAYISVRPRNFDFKCAGVT